MDVKVAVLMRQNRRRIADAAYIDLHAGMCADVCVDMCVDMCGGMCVGMCADMCADMCAFVQKCV